MDDPNHVDSTRDITEILADAPDNWEKWGPNDELGALNYLGPEEVLRGIASVSSGRTFTLGLPIGQPEGDPVWPTRSGTDHHMVHDQGDVEAGAVSREPYGGWHHTDDLLYMFTHGSTHFDSLGHAWYGDRLYNGFGSESTKGGLGRCGIEHPAANGAVGRGILLDVARHRGVDYLESGERITLAELLDCADEQGVTIEKRDVLLVRTGAMELFYREGPAAFYEEFEATHRGEPVLAEAGITYTEELAEWFAEMEIPLYGTDTVTAEQTISETTGTRLPLHPFLLRNLGVVISEMNELGPLAADCADDGQYEFLYAAAPLRVVGGSGGPANPIVVK